MGRRIKMGKNEGCCRVCGSARAGCPTLAFATQYAGMWCHELERALDRAPPRLLPGYPTPEEAKATRRAAEEWGRSRSGA